MYGRPDCEEVSLRSFLIRFGITGSGHCFGGKFPQSLNGPKSVNLADLDLADSCDIPQEVDFTVGSVVDFDRTEKFVGGCDPFLVFVARIFRN